MKFKQAVLAFLFLSSAVWAQNGAISYDRVSVQGTTINLVTVDLNSPDVEIRPVLAPAGNTIPLETLLAQGGQPVAAITGTFFDPASATTVGNVVSDGRLMTEGCVGSVLRIDDDGTARVNSLQGKLGRHVDWSGTKFAISAGPTLLVDGQESIAPASEGFKDPGLYGYRMRAAMGVTGQNQLLLLTTCRPVSLHELASIFQELGAVDAVNLDGGSSTAMAYDGTVVAHPCRRLTNLIAVYQAGTAPSQAASLGDQYAQAYQYSLVATRLFHQGELIKAHSQMRKAISMAPDRAPYWETLGQIQERLKKPMDAADSYVKAANLYLERSQMSRVQDCANNAFRLDPSLQAQHPELSRLAGDGEAEPSL
jgi:uncharacterized protein YigE (DUF2233 family)